MLIWSELAITEAGKEYIPTMIFLSKPKDFPHSPWMMNTIEFALSLGCLE
jgi:predicted LPLAT superfamily acyltransferase